MSQTLLPYINPPIGFNDLTQAVVNIAGVDNNFSVPQSFAGITNNSNLNVSGVTSLQSVNAAGLVAANAGLIVTGALTLPAASIADTALSSNVPLKNALNIFSAVNTFSSAPVMSGASISPNTIPAVAIVNDSLGDGQIASGGIGQTSVANGYVDLINTQTVAGTKTFNQPPVMSGASIAANSVPALAIVNDSLGDAQISAGGVGQSSISSGYVDLVNAQAVAGIKSFNSPPVMSGASIAAASVPDAALTSNVPLKNALNTFSAVNTFSSAPVMSGASISANSIPALSIVNNSLGDAQITPAGIGQASLLNGYVDLSSSQTITGNKTYTALNSYSQPSFFNNGFNGASGAFVITPQLSVGALSTTGNITQTTGNMTTNGSITANGGFIGNASRVVITSDNTNGNYFLPFTKLAGSNVLFADDTVTPLVTYNPSTGTINTQVLNIAGITTLNGVILPLTQTVLTITAGAIAINLNGLSNNEFILPSANFNANVTAITFSNAPVNAKFNIYVQGGAANRNWNKNISSGAVSQVNNLGGNTQIGAGTTWLIRGVVLTSTLVSLDFTNYT